MQKVIVENVPTTVMKGRAIRKIVGKDSLFDSSAMTCGRTIFSTKYGTMDPHCHAEEILYIVDHRNGRLIYGDTEECKESIDLENDMLLYIAPGEWHAFDFDSEDDYANVLFFYPTTENIRPEDNK